MTFQSDLTSLAFLDGNKDGVTDIILGTSAGITAIDINGQSVWSTTIPFVVDLIIEDIDGFAEKEIIGYTKDTVFILKYNGGIPIFIDFSPYEITALSMYDASNEKYIIVASSNGILSWIDYHGEKKDVQNFNMDVSQIIFSQTRIPGYTRNFLFVISDKGQAKAIDLSGSEVDNFGVYDNILNIESANLDKKEIRYGDIDYDETVISGLDGRIIILIHYFKEKIEGMNKFEWLEIRNYTGDFEKVAFSQLVEERPDHFILFQVSQNGEMQKYDIFFDTTWFFSMYNQAIQWYDLGDYVAAFSYFDEILSDDTYRELAEYYGLYEDCVTKKDECQNRFEAEKMRAEQKLSEGLGKVETDTFGAVKDLFEAYVGFKKANFKEEDVVDENLNLTRKDVGDQVLHLVFPLLKEADQEYEEKNYEEALTLFSRIYPAYEEFPQRIEDRVDMGDFEEYETLIEKYPNHWTILSKIGFCKENIEKKADNLFNEGKFKDAKNKYETIRMALIDRGESEDSNAVKEIADKIFKCDLGIQPPLTETPEPATPFPTSNEENPNDVVKWILNRFYAIVIAIIGGIAANILYRKYFSGKEPHYKKMKTSIEIEKDTTKNDRFQEEINSQFKKLREDHGIMGMNTMENLETVEKTLTKAPVDQQEEIRETYLQAIALAEGGQYDDAYKILQNILDGHPSFYIAWLDLGNVLSYMGKNEEACNAYLEFEKHTNDTVELSKSWHNRANVLFRQGKKEQALELYGKTLKICPDEFNPLIMVSQLLIDEEKYDEASTHMKKAISLDLSYPQRIIAYEVKLRALEKQHKTEEAGNMKLEIEKTKECLQLLSEGLEYGRKNHYEKAAEKFSKLIEMDPETSRAYYNKGLALEYMHRFPEALDCYSKSLSLNPEAENVKSAYSRCAYNVGAQLRSNGESEKAIEYFDRALEYIPLFYECLVAKGDALQDMGKYDDSISLYKLAIRAQPSRVEAYIAKGYSLIMINEKSKALKCYETALKIDPANSIAIRNKSRLLEEWGITSE